MTRSWQEKLTPEGLELIEMVAKLRRVKQPTSSDPSELRQWIKDEKAVWSSYPALDLEEKRKANLDPKFVEMLMKTDPEYGALSVEEMQEVIGQEVPTARAEQLEIQQRIALLLEGNQALRFDLYAAIAYAIVLGRRMFSSVRKKEFGTKDVGWTDLLKAFGRHLAWMGDIFRGNIRPEPGRVNVERADLVNTIFKFQKEPLTQKELYEAVKAAGGTVPEDPEAFRLWLFRARKDGLITDQ